jgi:hypothetical protein
MRCSTSRSSLPVSDICEVIDARSMSAPMKDPPALGVKGELRFAGEWKTQVAPAFSPVDNAGPAATDHGRSPAGSTPSVALAPGPRGGYGLTN